MMADKRWLFFLMGAFFWLVGCRPELFNPPRLQTQTAQASQPATPTSPTLALPAATATPGPTIQAVEIPAGGEPNPTITLWINHDDPSYRPVLERMAQTFQENYQINVEMIQVNPDLLPEFIQSAFVSHTLHMPDLVLIPLEYTIGWAERGILDVAANEALLDGLGRETFDPAGLQLATINGQVAAIPSDAWQQLIVYRRDWFAAQNLPPPLTFTSLITASTVISDRANLIYSFNMPTESSLLGTTWGFEQMALANGCHLIDQQGVIQILSAECQDTLDFYRYMCNSFCPFGVQTEVSALNAYLSGRSGIIIAPSTALPALAGLEASYPPTCAECVTAGFLAANSGFVSQITGRTAQASPVSFSGISYLSLTTTANREAAATFVRYWFEEGYLEWLAIDPAGKLPMRRGPSNDPTFYLEAWYNLPMRPNGPTLSQAFGPELAQQLANNLTAGQRWGFVQGQGALVTEIHESLTLSILLQELLSGYFNSERAAIEGYKRLVDLIPGYAFYIDPEPPTPIP